MTRTNRLVRCTVAALLIAAPAFAQSSRQGLTPLGNPSALVEAESALAHLARDKGAGAALAATADDGAEVLSPARTPARAWLHAHDATPWFDARQTANTWASCDGTAGVSAGTWRGGWFATVWKRQKKLNFRWVLADAGPLAVIPPSPDWITGKLADCPPRPPADEDAADHRRAGPAPARPLPAAMPASDAPAGADSRDGRSDDGSLVWRSTVLPGGAHRLQVWIWIDGALHGVLDRAGAAAG